MLVDLFSIALQVAGASNNVLVVSFAEHNFLPGPGTLLTEGVDPGRDEWKAWCSFRDSIAEEWNPDSLRAVAFILNRVSSSQLHLCRERPHACHHSDSSPRKEY